MRSTGNMSSGYKVSNFLFVIQCPGRTAHGIHIRVSQDCFTEYTQVGYSLCCRPAHAVVEFHNIHNHCTMSSHALSKRDVSETTQQTLGAYWGFSLKAMDQERR